MGTATATVRHICTETAIGSLTIVRDDAGFTGVYFPGHWTRPERAAFGPRAEAGAGPRAGSGSGDFGDLLGQLEEYLAGRRREFDLPLAPRGDERAQAAWRLIARIPYGSTSTYGALAKQFASEFTGKPGGQITARDFGWHVAHNPLSILIPCHRVVGADGSLTGYAGGLRRKRQLLELEGAIPPADQPLW
jgi:methylated-DNA-[protein]-cysteine S-methyltransferase